MWVNERVLDRVRLGLDGLDLHPRGAQQVSWEGVVAYTSQRNTSTPTHASAYRETRHASL